MNTHTDLVDRYFDTWNETDPARRRELIAATWTTDAVYVDPLLAGNGHDGILVTDPLSQPSHFMVLSFTDQAF